MTHSCTALQMGWSKPRSLIQINSSLSPTFQTVFLEGLPICMGSHSIDLSIFHYDSNGLTPGKTFTSVSTSDLVEVLRGEDCQLNNSIQRRPTRRQQSLLTPLNAGLPDQEPVPKTKQIAMEVRVTNHREPRSRTVNINSKGKSLMQ